MSATHPKILVTRVLPSAGHDLLYATAEKEGYELVQWTEDRPADREWILDEFKKGGVVAAVVQAQDKINEEFLEAAGPGFKVISTMSAGYDHISLPLMAANNIPVGTVPDSLTDACADTGAMLTLMASRRAGEAYRSVVDGKWPVMPWGPLMFCGHSLQKSTVGILGFGRIGQLTLQRLLGFGISRALYLNSTPGVPLPPQKDYFNLLHSNPSAPSLNPTNTSILPASSLKHLAESSDFLIICCGLSEKTRKLVGKEFLGWMKETAYIVNTGRGGVVDSEALLEAVQSGKLAGAGLDVVDGEPHIGADHFLVKEEKIVILPHIGSATLETRGAMAADAVKNCLAGLGVEGFEWAYKQQ
ncbi:glyoxylate reductase [Pseudohyphozyma bogoriensis]|nr:glyoxylate reductase [Pseudohyphozyma bogoriensis]